MFVLFKIVVLNFEFATENYQQSNRKENFSFAKTTHSSPHIELFTILFNMIRRGSRYFTTSRFLRNNLPLLQENNSATTTPEVPKNFKIHTVKPSTPDELIRTIRYDDDNVVKITELKQDRRSRLTTCTMSVAEYFLGNTHHSHHVFYLNMTLIKAKKAAKVEKRKFIDLKLIKITSGNGGNGSVSFLKIVLNRLVLLMVEMEVMEAMYLLMLLINIVQVYMG